MPARVSRLRSGRGPTPSGKPIRKVNPEQRAKRKKRQASKHAAYMRSETRKIVDARANGRCEAAVRTEPGFFQVQPRDFLTIEDPNYWFCITLRAQEWTRCENTTRLQHHHLTYTRYGGNELPEDILKCCRRCHDWLESQHPTRNRR